MSHGHGLGWGPGWAPLCGHPYLGTPLQASLLGHPHPGTATWVPSPRGGSIRTPPSMSPCWGTPTLLPNLHARRGATTVPPTPHPRRPPRHPSVPGHRGSRIRCHWGAVTPGWGDTGGGWPCSHPGPRRRRVPEMFPSPSRPRCRGISSRHLHPARAPRPPGGAPGMGDPPTHPQPAPKGGCRPRRGGCSRGAGCTPQLLGGAPAGWKRDAGARQFWGASTPALSWGGCPRAGGGAGAFGVHSPPSPASSTLQHPQHPRSTLCSAGSCLTPCWHPTPPPLAPSHPRLLPRLEHHPRVPPPRGTPPSPPYLGRLLPPRHPGSAAPVPAVASPCDQAGVSVTPSPPPLPR